MQEITNNDLVDLQNAINRQLPLRGGLSILAGQIRDCRDQLFAEELSECASAVAKRQNEFATGRVTARLAMAEIGLNVAPVLRGEHREPTWPAEMVGSITHTEQWAVAGVARRGSLMSLGLDLEIADRVGPHLHGNLFTEAEQDFLSGAEPRMAGLLFSAKEAGYKATFPLARRYIGFKEAEVRVNEGNEGFTLRYLGEHEPNRIMELAEGYFLFCGRYVLSMVIIPQQN